MIQSPGSSSHRQAQEPRGQILRHIPRRRNLYPVPGLLHVCTIGHQLAQAPRRRRNFAPLTSLPFPTPHPTPIIFCNSCCIIEKQHPAIKFSSLFVFSAFFLNSSQYYIAFCFACEDNSLTSSRDHVGCQLP